MNVNLSPTFFRGCMRKSVIYAVVALLVASASVSAQDQSRTETGFLDRSVTLNGTTYRYQIFVPSFYAPTKRWPVILFLHGAGERGSDGYMQTQVGLALAIRQNAARFPAIAVFPQATAESSWTGTLARVALIALDQTMREYQTDPSRVYLTGLSMGGNGTWYIAYRNPGSIELAPRSECLQTLHGAGYKAAPMETL